MQTDLRYIVDYHVVTCIEHTIKRHVSKCINNYCVDSVKTGVALTVVSPSAATDTWFGVKKCVKECVYERLE